MIDTCDVLVAGGGGAALRAAIAAHEVAPGLTVALVSKGELGRSGVTATACSDRMAFHATLPTTAPGGPEAWRHHARDIYGIGGQVSDADLADSLARHGAQAFDYLDKLGVPWVRRPDGTVDQFVTDGSEYARACYTGPFTANHIEEALVRRLRELPIQVIEGHMLAELLLDDTRQRVIGSALVRQGDGRIAALRTKAVVLATGGAGQIYSVNVYPEDCTGDGYALAYRAGADLVNLEFIQIGLCSTETGLACSGSMMRALPRLVTDNDEEFLHKYFPPGTAPADVCGILFAKGASWPVSHSQPSRAIDIAVATELAAGHRVFLDYSHEPEGLRPATLPDSVRAWYREKRVSLGDPAAGTPLARLEAINRPSVEWLAARGIDLRSGDLVEIAPAIQHFQGGVKIRARGETTIGGLYAAGEVAGGQHGANRPGGNALLDCQVFGRIAGESAARHSLSQRQAPGLSPRIAEKAVRALFSPGGADPAMVRSRVTREMSGACSVYRTERGLRALGESLDDMARCGVNARAGSLPDTVEAVNILLVARLVARAALERRESRGPHLRFSDDGSLTPLPRDDGNWTEYIVLRRGEGGPVLVRRKPVRPD